MVDIFAWLGSFFLIIGLIVIIIFQLMCLADLEFDYINPYDSSSRINKVVMPEFIGQGILCCFYLATGHWAMSLFCVPHLYYNVNLAVVMPEESLSQGIEGEVISVYTVKSIFDEMKKTYMVELYIQRKHLIDVTEIYNMLKWEKKQRLFKLSYLICILFLSIFWMIMNALSDHD